MKSTRNLLSLVVALCGSAFLFPAQAEEVVNVFSHRHYEADQALFDKFTEQTGIKVNVVKAKADALISRLQSEGEKTEADVFITADAGRLARAKDLGLLQAVESDVLTKNVPENLRDSEGTWYGFTVRARVIIYNKDKVKPEELSTFEDLADPKWKGRILVRSSGNIYNQSLLASLIAAHGSEKALEWAKGVRANMARPPQGSDRDQMRAVAQGLGDIAIANTYYLGLLLNSSDEADVEKAKKLAIFFPNQGEGERGTHINISGGGVTKHAKNRENAIKLLEFLVSEEAQKTFPETTYEYPLDLSAVTSELVKSWGTFQPDSLPLEKLGENNAEAVKVFAEADWK